MTRRAADALVITVFLLLMASSVAVAPRLFVLFDEAYNLNLIKTLAEDGRYASHLAEGYRLFDPAVTTGPPLVVPLAVALRLGGATIGVVRATMVIIFLISLAIVFLAAWQMLRSRVAALVFLLLFFTTPLILEYGLCVLGDVPSIALAIGACGLLNRSETSEHHRLGLLVASGICLGLAILVKDIVALLLPAMVGVWVFDGLSHRPTDRGRLLSDGIPIVIGAAMAIGWRAFQLVYARLLLPEDAFRTWSDYARAVSQTFWHTVVFAPLAHDISIAGYSLTYHVPFVAAVPILIAGLVGVRLLLAVPLRFTEGPVYTWRVIAVGFGFWLVWFFLLSGPQAIHRHLVPAMILGQLLAIAFMQGLVYALRQQPLGRWRYAAVGIVAAIIALLLLWHVANGIGFVRLYLRSSEQRLAAQRTVATWISEHVPPEAALSGWGWYVPWHIAFLADRLPAQAHPETSDLQGLTDWFVLAPEIEWSGGMDDRLRGFLSRQGPPVTGHMLYAVYQIVWRPVP